MSLSAETLRALVRYSPESGEMIWRERSRGHDALAEVGWTDVHGYRRGRVAGGSYLIHRLVWLYMYGHWPAGYVDHINGDPLDNRIANLRLATGSQNQANRATRRDNRSGVTGVRWHAASKKWLAEIQIGSFATLDKAAAARRRVELFLWGDFVPAPDRREGVSVAAERSFQMRQMRQLGSLDCAGTRRR